MFGRRALGGCQRRSGPAGSPGGPGSHFLRVGSSEFPDQLLAAPADRLPQFGEGAAAPQVVRPVLGAGPAGTPVS